MPPGIYPHKPNQGFQKGHKIGLGNKNTFGKKIHSEETKKKSRERMIGNSYAKGLSGEKSSRWKGDKVGYYGLHMWVKKYLGKPKKCEFCGKDGLKGRQIHWANIDHSYKRNLNDWIRLCFKCHRKFDKEFLNNGRIN